MEGELSNDDKRIVENITGIIEKNLVMAFDRFKIVGRILLGRYQIELR